MPGYISIKVGLPQAGMASDIIKNKQLTSKIKENPGIFDKNVQLKKACVELESVFIYHLLKEMRATIPESGSMGGESIKEMYSHMVDSQLARKLSSDGGVGLSELLIRQLNQTAYNGTNNTQEKID